MINWFKRKKHYFYSGYAQKSHITLTNYGYFLAKSPDDAYDLAILSLKKNLNTEDVVLIALNKI